MTAPSTDSARRRYIGGMRYGGFNATLPLARLTVDADGISVGPSVGFLQWVGVPTKTFRWADLTQVEPVGFAFLPVLADGVRFSAFGTRVIFWTGSRRRSSRILDVCEAAAPGRVSRTRQSPPLFGS